MKRNLNLVLTNLDGSDFFQDQKCTLALVCFTALTTPMPKDAELPVTTKLAYYKLAQKVVAGGVVEFTSEELSTLKARIGTVYNHIVIVGRAYDTLDADFVEPEEVPQTEV